MSRLFLTNIDLNTNELQNAVIQNLSSAPLSGNKEGRIYYDVTNKALYLYTDGQWKPLASGGAAASSIQLTGDVTGTATVDPATGKLTVATTVDSSFVTLTGTQTLTNKELVDPLLSGELKLEDSTGTFNALISLSSDELVLDTNSRNIILQPEGGSLYLQNSTDNNNKIATIGDLVNVTLNIQGTENQIVVNDQSGVSTISLPSYVEIKNGDSYSSLVFNSNAPEIGLNDPISDSRVITINNNGTTAQIQANSGDLNLSSTNNIYIKPDVSGGGINGNLYLDTNNVFVQRDIDLGRRIRVGGSDWNQDGTIQALSSDGTSKFVVDAGTGAVYLDNYTTLQFNTNNANVASIYVDDNLILDGQNGITLNALNGNSAVINSNGILYLNSNEHVQINPSLNIGGSGTNGSLTVQDSNGTNVINVDGSTQETTFAGNVTVGGNLNVTGTLNAVNRTEINVEDNTIVLNSNWTGAPTEDAGIIVKRGTANDTAIIWSETNDQWTLTNDGSHYYGIARKYVEVIGDASNTSFDVVHNLGTRDITVMVRENNAEYNVVETDIRMKDNNTVTIAFTDAPASNAYKVIIVG